MIEASTLVAASVFSLATSITPGPNTLMLATSGINHGLKNTVPHLFGINLGIFLMMLAIGGGAGQTLMQYPQLQIWLKMASTGYLLWLTWGILRSSALPTDRTSTKQPISFFQAMLLQWINPKVWMMGIVSMTTFTHAGNYYELSVLAVALTMMLVNLPSIFLWAASGHMIRSWLTQPLYQRLFNLVLGALTLGTIVIVWLE